MGDAGPDFVLMTPPYDILAKESQVVGYIELCTPCNASHRLAFLATH